MSESDGDQPGTSIRVQWPRDVARSPQLVNQMVMAQAPANSAGHPDHGVYLMLGHVMAPFLASPEEADEFYSSGPVLDIDLLGTYYLSHPRIVELHGLLSQYLASAEASAGRTTEQ